MLHILLVGVRPDRMRSFVKALTSDPEVCFEQVTSGAEALGTVRAKCPHLVIIDSEVPDVDSLELVRRMICINAMVNTAVVSSLSDADFHDKSEGLGILCRLPPDPSADDSAALLRKLRSVLGIGEAVFE